MSEKTSKGTNASDQDYTVGKGKPPKEHQFRQGASGNPRGRPKNCRSTQEEVKHHLDGYMTVRTGAGSEKMSRRKVLVRTLFERAAKGDNRAADMLLRNDLAALQPSGDLVRKERPQEPDDPTVIASFDRRAKREDG